MHRLKRLVVMGGLIALVAVAVIAVVNHLSRHSRDYLLTSGTEMIPAPWLIPVKPGEAVLHLTMVHDVIHERFPRHGPAWFTARQVQTQAELDRLSDQPTDDERRFALLDDLAVGYERLGQPGLGILILRRKLERQLSSHPEAQRTHVIPALYTTYANLGTLLIHASFAGARSGKADDLARLSEGGEFIRLAMQANPDAHFGRETWQAEAVEAMLANIANPKRLLIIDMMGLDMEDDRTVDANRLRFGYAHMISMAGGFDSIQQRSASGDISLTKQVREYIPLVRRKTASGVVEQRPFDEPTLGLVGMWTLGGGANPHSALALAHLMESVQQRRIAWDAYERAIELGSNFWPDPQISAQLLDHCRKRQRRIQEHLGVAAEVLRAQHQRELTKGLEYRAAYQAYEAAQLTSGRSVRDPQLNADFLASHPPIASQPSDEDAISAPLPPRFVDTLPLWIAGLAGLVVVAMTLQAIDRRYFSPA